MQIAIGARRKTKDRHWPWFFLSRVRSGKPLALFLDALRSMARNSLPERLTSSDVPAAAAARAAQARCAAQAHRQDCRRVRDSADAGRFSRADAGDLRAAIVGGECPGDLGAVRGIARGARPRDLPDAVGGHGAWRRLFGRKISHGADDRAGGGRRRARFRPGRAAAAGRGDGLSHRAQGYRAVDGGNLPDVLLRASGHFPGPAILPCRRRWAMRWRWSMRRPPGN